MRASVMLAGAAFVLAACGGEKADSGTPAPAPAASDVAPAAAGGSETGTVHEVQMTQDGAVYHYVPADLTIKSGDVVVFKGVSGIMHDIRFFADSIPPGAAAVLNAAMADKAGDLASPMVMDGQEYRISFAGAPAGEYKFFCLPHTAMGMFGKITVTE